MSEAKQPRPDPPGLAGTTGSRRKPLCPGRGSRTVAVHFHRPCRRGVRVGCRSGGSRSFLASPPANFRRSLRDKYAPSTIELAPMVLRHRLSALALHDAIATHERLGASRSILDQAMGSDSATCPPSPPHVARFSSISSISESGTILRHCSLPQPMQSRSWCSPPCVAILRGLRGTRPGHSKCR